MLRSSGGIVRREREALRGRLRRRAHRLRLRLRLRIAVRSEDDAFGAGRRGGVREAAVVAWSGLVVGLHGRASWSCRGPTAIRAGVEIDCDCDCECDCEGIPSLSIHVRAERRSRSDGAWRAGAPAPVPASEIEIEIEIGIGNGTKDRAPLSTFERSEEAAAIPHRAVNHRPHPRRMRSGRQGNLPGRPFRRVGSVVGTVSAQSKS